MTVAALIPVIPEEAYVGETLHLVADTKVDFLASLDELRIGYRQGRRATAYLAATIVSGEPSKMEAVMPYTTNDLSCQCRLWAWGRGPGTPIIRFNGKPAILRILPEGG